MEPSSVCSTLKSAHDNILRVVTGGYADPYFSVAVDYRPLLRV